MCINCGTGYEFKDGEWKQIPPTLRSTPVEELWDRLEVKDYLYGDPYGDPFFNPSQAVLSAFYSILGPPHTGRGLIAKQIVAAASNDQESAWHQALLRFKQRPDRLREAFQFVDNSWAMPDEWWAPLYAVMHERVWYSDAPEPCEFRPQLTPDWTGP